MEVVERLKKLRGLMEEAGITYYLIPTGDYHLSEYTGAHFAVREYLSGFTGSAGTLLVGQNQAGLWTDGRYYIQAEQELLGSGITLFRQGSEGVPSAEEYLRELLKPGDCVGFDGRTMPAAKGRSIQTFVQKAGGQVVSSRDLAGEFWEDRPPLPDGPVYRLDEKYAGESASGKLTRLRDQMTACGANVHILTMLDDIAWLLNIRGDDIPCTPVVLAYAMITQDEVLLFADGSKFDTGLRMYLTEIGVRLLDYEEFYTYLAELPATTTVLYDRGKVNYAVDAGIPKGVRVIWKENPTLLMKARKNPVEQENLIRAHIKDGVAVTKFIYWVKTQVGRQAMTELSATAYLEACRKEQPGYLEPSFDTICAYKEHAAMMHYSADEESDVRLLPEGLLLVDSGGQYLEGTTDITRTIVLGPVSEEIKRQYTAVLRGMLNLANARFLSGCTGVNLDILARGPVWDLDLDYRCGTGHGVGYLLGVHEPPNNIRWRRTREDVPLEAGMLTSDEPGVYVEGSHGIRIENLLLCKEGPRNEYGQFLYFENITLAPVDLDAVLVQELTPADRQRLNTYHQKVFDTLSSYLTPEESEWLRHETRPVS